METLWDRERDTFEGGYGICRDHIRNHFLGFRVYRSYMDSGKEHGNYYCI